jgi:hypothetical protein
MKIKLLSYNPPTLQSELRAKEKRVRRYVIAD